MDKTTFRDIKKASLETANIIIAGIPYDKNTSIGRGAALAPARIRLLSQSIPGVTQDGDELSATLLYDFGDIEAGNLNTESYFAKVEQSVLPLFKKEALTIFLGGDHSVNIPLFKAFLTYTKKVGKTPVLIHIDAHPDMMENYDNNVYSHATPARYALKHGLDENNLTFIGLRGFEKEEVVYFKEHPAIKVYRASDVFKRGVDQVIAEVVQKYQSADYLIYLSYDIDVNDPSFAPGTGTPEAFGLTSRDTLALLIALTTMPNAQALDIVEISPPLDVNNLTSWLALKTLYEIFYERGLR